MSLSVNAQQADYVDFKKIEAAIFFQESNINAVFSEPYIVTFDILKKTDSIYLDAVNMKFKNISLNGDSIRYRIDGKKLIIYNRFKPSKENKLRFNYSVSPKKAIYFVGWENAAPNQIWTQGQGKYTSHWLPSIDDMNDKIEFDLSYIVPDGYLAISNGSLVAEIDDNGFDVFKFNMSKPMSSYLVGLVVGKYNKKEVMSKSGIPLEMYYYPEDTLKEESTYRYTKEMFDFLEEEIGVPYPWQNYKQVPVHDFLYSGMENTSVTIFSDAFVVDSIGFNDRNYVNVNAHELAHQWFGNLVTETSGTHHWLQEGFATYYALLAEREVFDENYYYWRLYEYAQELFDQDNRDQGTSLLDPKSSSVTFYKRGAWVLHALKELVGEVVFKEAVKNYLNKYQFQNVETSDFVSEVENLYGKSLEYFVSEWIESESFPYNQAMASLEKSLFIQEYLMADCEARNAKCDYYLSAPLSQRAKAKIVSQVPERIVKDVFNDGLIVRQSIARNLTKIPENLKTNYESLLDDESYLTVEFALYNLWVNFPKDRHRYLDKTQYVIGFNDKNVRLLWLALAVSTTDYRNLEKKSYFEELSSYTSENYGFEVRQSAFSYLEMLNLFSDEALGNLWNASKHFNWRFKSFSTDLIERLSDEERYRDKIILLKSKN